MPKYNTTCCCENDVSEFCIGKCMDEDSAPRYDSIPICDQNNDDTPHLDPRISSFCDKFINVINKCITEQGLGNNCMYESILP